MEKKAKVLINSELDPSVIAKFVQIANQFQSTLYIEMSAGRRVNAKSIMGMMNFLAGDGDEVTVYAEGPDEEAAAEAIATCLAEKSENWL